MNHAIKPSLGAGTALRPLFLDKKTPMIQVQ